MIGRLEEAVQIAVWVFVFALFVAATVFIGLGTILGCLYVAGLF